MTEQERVGEGTAGMYLAAIAAKGVIEAPKAKGIGSYLGF